VSFVSAELTPVKGRYDSAVSLPLSTAGTWIGWTNVGSGFAGVPGFSEDGSGIFHVFAVSTGGALEVNSQEGGGHSWTGWTTLGSSFAGS
jgi:hypothetical protein